MHLGKRWVKPLSNLIQKNNLRHTQPIEQLVSYIKKQPAPLRFLF